MNDDPISNHPIADETLTERAGDEIEATNDPGIESDEEIDGQIDAEGGRALKRRTT